MKNIKKISTIILITILLGAGGIFLWFRYGTTGADNLEDNLKVGDIYAKGNLTQMDPSHWGTGVVQIVKISDVEYELQFIDVEIATGPDLFVHLSEKETFSSVSENPGEIINLGKLPAQTGTFSIEIPTGTDISDIKSVVIWCNAAKIVFSFAQII